MRRRNNFQKKSISYIHCTINEIIFNIDFVNQILNYYVYYYWNFNFMNWKSNNEYKRNY